MILSDKVLSDVTGWCLLGYSHVSLSLSLFLADQSNIVVCMCDFFNIF